MPIYAFRCETCGPFDIRRQMSEAGHLATCPSCGADAERVLTAPNLYRTSPPYRNARDLEEKSADSPTVVTRPPEGFVGRTIPSHHHHHTPPWVLSH